MHKKAKNIFGGFELTCHVKRCISPIVSAADQIEWSKRLQQGPKVIHLQLAKWQLHQKLLKSQWWVEVLVWHERVGGELQDGMDCLTTHTLGYSSSVGLQEILGVVCSPYIGGRRIKRGFAIVVLAAKFCALLHKITKGAPLACYTGQMKRRVTFMVAGIHIGASLHQQAGHITSVITFVGDTGMMQRCLTVLVFCVHTCIVVGQKIRNKVKVTEVTGLKKKRPAKIVGDFHVRAAERQKIPNNGNVSTFARQVKRRISKVVCSISIRIAFGQKILNNGKFTGQAGLVKRRTTLIVCGLQICCMGSQKILNNRKITAERAGHLKGRLATGVCGGYQICAMGTSQKILNNIKATVLAGRMKMRVAIKVCGLQICAMGASQQILNNIKLTVPNRPSEEAFCHHCLWLPDLRRGKTKDTRQRKGDHWHKPHEEASCHNGLWLPDLRHEKSKDTEQCQGDLSHRPSEEVSRPSVVCGFRIRAMGHKIPNDGKVTFPAGQVKRFYSAPM